MLWLTIPQLLLYVLGLPLTAAIIILRNKKHLHQKKFYTRYGLLYMGCTSFLLIHVYDILFIYTILHLVLTIFLRSFSYFLSFYLFPFFRTDREGKEWWEVVITIRKVAVVAIGTFGTFMGVVDLQAFVALGIVFFSIVVHLIGQPFDTNKANGKRLHNLEFTALTVCWCTFW